MFDFHCGNNSLIKDRISELYCIAEEQYIPKLIAMLEDSNIDEIELNDMIENIIEHVSKQKLNQIELFMNSFDLSTEEGIAILCLGESLLLIPDKYTQNLIITDTVYRTNWINSNIKGLFAPAIKWGLAISSKVMIISQVKLLKYTMKPITIFGEPLIRAVIKLIVELLGEKFIIGQNIHNAIHRNKSNTKFSFSYNIIQKTSYTKTDSYHAFTKYINSLHTLGYINKYNSVRNNSISLKLSSLFHNYKFRNLKEVIDILLSRLKEIFTVAIKYNIIVFIEAEEADKIEISLELLELLLADKNIRGYNGIGFVVEATAKRCVAIVDYLIHLSHRFNTKLFIQLSTGTHWQTEIAKAQEINMQDYPVFTKLEYINIAYFTCAIKMLDHIDAIKAGFEVDHPIFIPIIYQLFKNKPFELHFVYGMFNDMPTFLHDEYGIKCRIFGPIGKAQDVLPTLLSYQFDKPNKFHFNTFFCLQNNNIDIKNSLIVQARQALAKSQLPKPSICYSEELPRAKNINLASGLILRDTHNVLNSFSNKIYDIKSCVVENIFLNLDNSGVEVNCYSIDNHEQLSYIQFASEKTIEHALFYANNKEWLTFNKMQKIDCLNLFCKLIEENYYEIISILCKEIGKSIFEALKEIRDAVDVARLYSWQLLYMQQEYSHLGLICGFGSWNNPVLSMINAIISCLVTNNPIIFKPSEFASTVSWFICQLLYRSGIPKTMVQLIIGYGHSTGSYLLNDDNIKCIIFDGSLPVAHYINRTIAAKPQPVKLIAHTSNYMNIMFIDSSILIQKALSEACHASFNYAGQNHESLKILYIQSEIFDKAVKILRSIVKELKAGNAQDVSSDLGPVINKKTQEKTNATLKEIKQSHTMIQSNLSKEQESSNFIAPTIIIVQSLQDIPEKMQGPILYILKAPMNNLNNLVQDIKQYGNALSLVIYSNIVTVHKIFINKFSGGNICINHQIFGNIISNPLGTSILGSSGCKKASPNFIYQLTNCKVNINQIHTLHIHHEQDLLINHRINILRVFMNNIRNNKKSLGITESQYESLFNLFKQIQENCLLNKEICLPSTLHQKSVMRFYPIGSIGVFSESLAGYIQQVIYVIGNGNTIVFHRNKYSLKLKSLLPYKIAIYCYSLIDYYHVDSILFENNYHRASDLKISFSQRSGSILTVVDQNPDGTYNDLSFVREVTISKAIENRCL
jgi:RHH-type proline utilization regulon transcriptional repressor/proline dehydrogenase/delta 1-pyrroline-5-carboxylate dehydrogenase